MPQDTETADLFGVPAPPQKTKLQRAPAFYIVPSGAKLSPCRGEDCDAQVYWVAGYPAPISCDVENGMHPDSRVDESKPKEWPAEFRTFKHDGRGLSHFTNCPNADEFSSSRRKTRGGTVTPSILNSQNRR